ncbi:MAG: efflux RND transporter periplasmic adaptor subunit [Kiritimatiellaeota bacterium]|nr:efflux RND transporter periplasmic adaptor subunit [Kiritimatiellota bacterium]
MVIAGCRPQETVQSEQTESAQTAPLMVRAMEATPRTFERRVTVQGTLEAKRFANVATRIGGNIDALPVDKGDTVEAGVTELFQIDAVSLKNALVAAQQQWAVATAAVAAAEATQEKAEKDFERFARLHQAGTVSDNEFETRQMQHKQAEAALALARAQEKQAEAHVGVAAKNMEDSRGIAPISGIVTKRFKEPGEQADAGKPILRIEDLSTIEAVAFLPAEYYGEVTAGETKARLRISGKEAGEMIVSYKSPSINSTLRTFEIKGAVADPAAVPGAMAEVTLIFSSETRLGVPTSAVLTRNGKPSVFVVNDGVATLTAVTTGLHNNGFTEILSGLPANALVITEGQSQVREGQSVTVL